MNTIRITKVSAQYSALSRFIIPLAMLFLSAELTAWGGLPSSDLTLWYQQPAKHPVNETLPIGNGRLGGLIFGEPQQERVIVNEISLWTGDENPSGNYDTMGAYQVLGELLVSLPGHEKAGAYRRDLDLATATAHVSYEIDGVTYRREFFASHPANVLVARFTADKRGSLTGSIALKDAHDASVSVSGTRFAISGVLKNGLKYEWQALVREEGGSIRTNGAALDFSGCDSVTVLLVAGTDYVMDHSRRYRGEPPHMRVTSALEAAAKLSYERLKEEHVENYQSLFNRVALDVGSATAVQCTLPTDRRKVEAAKTVDPGLEQLLFQYGRYLMISCSRPGSLPANLQGLWNDRNTPPWHCDYHANINVQMNYWPAEPTGLPECHVPFFDLIKSQLEPWRKATAGSSEFKAGAGPVRGWAIRTSHNIFGGLGWKWDKTANAWYCQHLWEHYAFGLDKTFLKDTAYPIMKETCDFWQDHLKRLPDGRFVVPNGWSPEHGPDEDGVSYNQQIVWDLFNNTIEAAGVLGIDKDYAAQLAGIRDRLVAPGIGRWGQLKEWMTDRDDPNDHHRHTSHLFAVFPGRQISMATTPELAKAAKVSLDARGSTGDVREWSFAWRTALYARLHDGESAHQMLQQLFAARNTCPNLFGLHPPMQIDGNFGITAGIAEMLVQSHEHVQTSDSLDINPFVVHLLPALPTAWSNGSVRGLRARGGFEVDMAWKDSKLQSVAVRSVKGGRLVMRYGDKTVSCDTRTGSLYYFDGLLNAIQKPPVDVAPHP